RLGTAVLVARQSYSIRRRTEAIGWRRRPDLPPTRRSISLGGMRRRPLDRNVKVIRRVPLDRTVERTRWRPNPTSLPRAGLSSNHDLDVQIERHQQVHQAFEREARQLVMTERRYLWLRHTEHLGCIGLREPSRFKHLIQKLVASELPLEARLAAVPCRGGETFLRGLFEPVGYTAGATRHKLDESMPAPRPSRLFTITLHSTRRLRDLLTHVYVLVPCTRSSGSGAR